MIQMQTVFPKARPTLPRLARLAAVALLALVAVPVVLPGMAQAAIPAVLPGMAPADSTPVVAFAEQAYTVAEGNLAILPIQLSEALDEDLEIVVATSDGTAVAPGDYVGVSIPTTIHAGREQITLLLVTMSDDVADDSEALTVSIRLAAGAPAKAGADATVTIREQPPGPARILPLTYEEGVDGAGPTVLAEWEAAPEPGRYDPPYNKAVGWVARIYVTDRPEDGEVREAVVGQTRAAFSDLEPGETYTVRVHGINQWGNEGERVSASITLPE